MDNKNVKKITVIGAGTMGTSLVQAFILFGLYVNIYDISSKSLSNALTIIKANIEDMSSNNKLESEKVDETINRIKICKTLEESVHNTDIVIETIIEKKEIKKELYRDLDKILDKNTIIASNTSFLDIFEIMPKRRLPKTVIAHWFSPPHLIPLVEIVRGEDTSSETIDTMMDLLKKMGKVPVLLNKFVTGFCINRIQRAIGREVFFLLDNNIISHEDLDLAVKTSLIPRSLVLGFVQRYDFTGMDLSALNYKNEDYEEAPLDNEPKTLFEKVKEGNLGIKTGKGFYDYSEKPSYQILKARNDKLKKVIELLDEIGTGPVE